MFFYVSLSVLNTFDTLYLFHKIPLFIYLVFSITGNRRKIVYQY